MRVLLNELAVNRPAPAKTPLPVLDDHEAEEIDLPIGSAQTGFRNPRVAFAGGRGQRRLGFALHRTGMEKPPRIIASPPA